MFSFLASIDGTSAAVIAVAAVVAIVAIVAIVFKTPIRAKGGPDGIDITTGETQESSPEEEPH